VGRGYLGAGLQHVRVAGENGRRSGVLVVSIDPDGPAAKAGLLVGDIVTSWNGAAVERARDVMRLLGSDSVGKTAALKILRGGAASEVNVTIGERPLN
jgi:S1-C subfamily serine protease